MKPDNNYSSLRPATHEEASLLYLDGQTDRSLGTMGHVRIDFDSSGKGFYHTWGPHSGEQFNTPKFKEALQQFVDTMWENGPLKDLFSMGKFCRQNGRTITKDGRGYGYLAGMGNYRFHPRRTPNPGEYQYYLYCYDLHQRTLDRPVDRVSFANDEHMEFTAPQGYPRAIREELPIRDGTGFLFETPTDAPAVRKAVDDMVCDLYGERNPGSPEDYVFHRGPEMGEQQM